MKHFIKHLLVISAMALFAISCQNGPAVEIESIEILPAQDSLTVGDSIYLQVNIYPENATSKNFEIAVRKGADLVSLDKETLKVKGLKPGTVEIAAVTDNGKMAVSQIIVAPNQVEQPKTLVYLSDSETVTTHDDVLVKVTMTRDDLKFWIWIGEYEQFKDYTPQSMLEYDKYVRETLYRELKAAGDAVGLEVTMETVVENFACTNGPGVYSLKELNIAKIRPETQYIIWAYPIKSDGSIMCQTSEIAMLHVMTEEAPEGWVDPDDIVDPNYVPVESVTITAAKNTIMAGETLELEVTILPDNASNKEYTLTVSGGDKKSVEIVDLTHIRGVKAGTAYISATSKDNGIRADFMVTVEADPNDPGEEPEPEEPRDPADYDSIVEHDDFTIELVENTSSSITVTVTPTDDEEEYYVWRTMTKNFEPGGYWSDPDEGDFHAVRDTYNESEDPSKMSHIGTSTVTFSKLKADTEWTIMVFRCDAMGNKDGDLVKFNTYTQLAE